MSLKCLYNIKILSNFDPKTGEKIVWQKTTLLLDTDTEQRRPEPKFIIFFRIPEIDAKESIPPAYVAWRTGTITLFLLGS